jgi:spore coat polysaccharide biosynthesis predicted glycosyltransferase SpsG
MIIFRVDISPQTGLQHLRRCAYLAALLKKNNGVLICSREDKKAAKFLAEKGIRAEMGKEQYAVDIAKAKAVIFDLYHFSAPDSALLEKAKKAGVKTIQIVSAGGARQPADILVQPLAEVESQTAARQTVLSGPSYALLHHKFRHFNQAKRKYHKNIKNIFINLGDQVPYRNLRQTIDTLHRLHLRMKIAPGLNLKKADKRNLMKIYPGIHFCGRSESPARAYFEADLALVPAGEAALEAAAVGTPALYFCQEPGQEALASVWAEHQAGLKFSKLETLTIDSFRDMLVPLTPEHREAMGAAGRKLVDGLGMQRFFKILKEDGIIVSSR